ncbi:MAG: hypothetical protein JWM76_4480 [Pseudonocardiales bacterium]|nr:hypothetical protein [Pseudonocardiales bacterium]
MIGVTILYGLGLAYVVYWARGVIRDRRIASRTAASMSAAPLGSATEPTSASMAWSAVDDRQLARYIDGLPPLR